MILSITAALLAPYDRTRAAAPGVPDACRWLSAAEAQPYVGNRQRRPFDPHTRDTPSATGDSCVYRGSGGRQIIVTWTGEGARQSDDILKNVRDTMGGGQQKSGNSDMAVATNRVLVPGPAGPWDKVNWIPGGTLLVAKGDHGVNIDMGGASGKEEDALAIARLIVPRIDR